MVVRPRQTRALEGTGWLACAAGGVVILGAYILIPAFFVEHRWGIVLGAALCGCGVATIVAGWIGSPRVRVLVRSAALVGIVVSVVLLNALDVFRLLLIQGVGWIGRLA